MYPTRTRHLRKMSKSHIIYTICPLSSLLGTNIEELEFKIMNITKKRQIISNFKTLQLILIYIYIYIL